MHQKRKFERELKFFITRQQYLKKAENNDSHLFLEGLEKVNFEQAEQYYQNLSENTFEIIKQGFISDLSYLFISNYNQIMKYFNLLIPGLVILCRESHSQFIQQEQMKAVPFFFEVIRLQDIELIDYALNGLTMLSKYKFANFYTQEFMLYLIELINLQDSNLNVEQICQLISKLPEETLTNRLIDQLFSSRFQASIKYYLSLDSCTILNFLFKLLEKHLDLCFIVDNQFVQIISKLCDQSNYERSVQVFFYIENRYFISQNIFYSLRIKVFHNILIIVLQFQELKLFNNQTVRQTF
ncbi:unnamed protein product (macronuclear) [Paramecium tetraurelia]|uniref:Uncharacterized protein n=1 Tax=Paramecium tetraurelia TaxID=5888 RepID=A0CXV5_PARTE|nr:uncharacterized protein GSPATT00011254001 [Paramecium tetraurelia]CAK75622.1 unnamed protein product [Paramecium tetraurelia]|eukprot:XP_001443019.1 hypothetical protein (macronuclear) [Paramecium tetraurelia strain d4-2]